MKLTARRIRQLGVLLALLLIAPSCFFTIHETEVGIVTRFGKPQDGLADPGLHLKMPWPVDRVLRLDQRLLVFDNEPAEMLTRDKRNILVDSFVLWRIEDPLRFAQTVRTRLEAEARLLDLVTSALGAAVGQEPLDGLINVDPSAVRLRQVADRTAESVRATSLPSFGIAIVDLRLNGFNLPPQNRASVIERMRAERSRIATAYRSEGEEEALKIEAEATKEEARLLAEAEAEAEAIRGAGDAEALALLGEAYSKDPAFYRFLRDLESYERILDDNTTIFLESDSALLDTLYDR